MILAVDPDQPRDPRFPTQCERCRSIQSACEAGRLFTGKSCCPSCDHDHDQAEEPL